MTLLPPAGPLTNLRPVMVKVRGTGELDAEEKLLNASTRGVWKTLDGAKADAGMMAFGTESLLQLTNSPAPASTWKYSIVMGYRPGDANKFPIFLSKAALPSFGY